MDNSTFITNKYAIIFEGKNYAGEDRTYSVKLDIEFGEFTPLWHADSFKAKPLFYNKHIAEDFVNTVKTSNKPHITNFLKTWKVNIDSLRILELGYTNECNFEEVLLNI